MKSITLISISSTLICFASFFDGIVGRILAVIAAFISTIALIITIRETFWTKASDEEDDDE